MFLLPCRFVVARFFAENDHGQADSGNEEEHFFIFFILGEREKINKKGWQFQITAREDITQEKKKHGHNHGNDP